MLKPCPGNFAFLGSEGVGVDVAGAGLFTGKQETIAGSLGMGGGGCFRPMTAVTLTSLPDRASANLIGSLLRSLPFGPLLFGRLLKIDTKVNTWDCDAKILTCSLFIPIISQG